MSGKPDPVAVLIGTEAELVAGHLRGLDGKFTDAMQKAVAARKAALAELESELHDVLSSWPERVTRLETELLERARAAEDGGRVAREHAADERKNRLSLEVSLREVQTALARVTSEAAATLARAATSERAAGAEKARTAEAERGAAALKGRVTQLAAEREALLAECQQLRSRPGGALPRGRLTNVTGTVADIVRAAVAVGAIPARNGGDQEPIIDAYFVGDWVFFLNCDSATHGDESMEHEFHPPLSLAEADRFADDHPAPERIVAVLLGVVDPESAGIVGKCSLYTTEAAAIAARRLRGREPVVFEEPVSMEAAVRWCETALAAVLASGGTAAGWLTDVQGFAVQDSRPAGAFWFYDRAGGQTGQKTPAIRSAAKELKGCGFTVRGPYQRSKEGSGYHFDKDSENSKDPTGSDGPG